MQIIVPSHQFPGQVFFFFKVGNPVPPRVVVVPFVSFVSHQTMYLTSFFPELFFCRKVCHNCGVGGLWNYFLSRSLPTLPRGLHCVPVPHPLPGCSPYRPVPFALPAGFFPSDRDSSQNERFKNKQNK